MKTPITPLQVRLVRTRQLLSLVRKWRTGILLLMVAGLSTVAGCGTTKVTSHDKASVGQQLLDLEKAYKEGVISEKDYAKLKRKIIRDND